MAVDPPFSVLEDDGEPGQVPLVLLHGSHGSERDLLPMARRIAPGATRLALRGTLPLEQGHAFFRRRPDRTVDEADLRSRVPALVALLHDLVHRGSLSRPPVLLGFSNGAIMAAAVAAARPDLVSGAALLRPLSPYLDDASYAPSALPVLLVDGSQDARRRPQDGAELAHRLRRAGARVDHVVLPAGHPVTVGDEAALSEWFGGAALGLDPTSTAGRGGGGTAGDDRRGTS